MSTAANRNPVLKIEQALLDCWFAVRFVDELVMAQPHKLSVQNFEIFFRDKIVSHRIVGCTGVVPALADFSEIHSVFLKRTSDSKATKR